MEKYVERMVTAGGVYDSRIVFSFEEVRGLSGRISTMVEDEAIRNSPYAVKAHLASLELIAARRQFRLARFLFRETPEDYLFSMADGYKIVIPKKERRKLRKKTARYSKALKRDIARNLSLARSDALYHAFRTGEGIKATFIFGLIDMIKDYARERTGHFSD